MKRQIMKGLSALCAGAMTLFAASSLFVSCYDDAELRGEISGLGDKVAGLEQRLADLEKKLNDELGKIQRLFQAADAELGEADNAIQAMIKVAAIERNADGKIVVTMTDGETFEIEPADKNTNSVLTIVEVSGVKYWATVDANGKATSIGIPVNHPSIEFKFEDNVIYYTLDGGNSWVKVANIPEDAAAPIITNVTYTDKTATFYLGDYSFTVDIAEPLSFEVRAGKLYFMSEATQTVAVKTSGVTDVTVMAAPKGWWAEVNADGQIVITAPNFEDTQSVLDYETWTEIPGKYSATGYVKVHACGADGKCIVGKIAVEVAQYPLIVKAYGGNAYFELVGDSYWFNTFFYGVSTKETLEADVKPIIDGLNAGDWSIYDNYPNSYGEQAVYTTVADLLGSEPEEGTEYVIWALLESNNVMTYTMEDVMRSYYSLINVEITENESARTAYNIDITVDVTGADSYVALAIPQSYCETEEDAYYQKEQMAMAMAEGQYYGKLYTENYSGSALDIAEGTSWSMTGLYAPNSSVYVFILPLDGRPADAYTADDVVLASFKTSNLLPGGVIDANATEVTEYMGKVFSYEDWQYHDQLIVLDKYTELGVALTPSYTEGWTSFYYTFLTEDEWAVYGSDDALIVVKLLEGYGMTPQDYTDGFPAYLVNDVNPGEKCWFVALFVDEDGKYGALAKVELQSETLEYSAMTLDVASNVNNGVLANTNELKLTLTPSEAVSKYMYISQVTNYYNPYEGMDASELADEIFFSTSAVTVEPSELSDGVLTVGDHEFGSTYFFAIIACDANGAPMTEAVVLEYENMFKIENVISDASAFVGEPVVVVNMPESIGDSDDLDVYYFWEDQTDWGMGYYYRYYVNYTVTPAEGTEVKSILVNTNSYSNIAADAAGKASQVWQDTFGSYYSYLHSGTEAQTTEPRQFGHYNDEEAPAVVLMVSWTDADGNYYYKEIDLTADFAALKANLDADCGVAGGEEEVSSPDGKQWKFTWVDMGDVPSALDFGVTTEGQLAVGFDLEYAYGSELPEEMLGKYMQYMAWEYAVTPTDATSGVITVYSYDHFGDVISTQGTYSNYDGTTMTVTFDMLYLEDVVMTVAEETIPFYIEQYM